MEKKNCKGHVLAVPYPSQGHINPLLQFSKRLASKGLRATLTTTIFLSTSMKLPQSLGSVQIETISDGFDDGGFAEAESVDAYLKTMEEAGSRTLAELIKKHRNTSNPIDCIVYDSFLPWALDVAKEFGIFAATFFTQACSVNYIYYSVKIGLLSLPPSSTPIFLDGMPPLELPDMPSFISVPGSYPAYFQLLLNQYSNVKKADFVLINTFYALESEVVEAMSKHFDLLTVGPTVPSFYMDNRVPDDADYSLHLLEVDSVACASWLGAKPPGSVVYAAFGSMSSFGEEKTREMALGLRGSGYHFLWVVRPSEQGKLPPGYAAEVEASGKGMVVGWSNQLAVLSSPAVGCFVTHCGWNSTLEAVALGVPVVALPQWTDQTTNAKLVEDMWKIGVRARADGDGVVRRDEIEKCIREVMEGERGKEMKKNAEKGREMAKETVGENGTSDRSIDEFVSKFAKL